VQLFFVFQKPQKLAQIQWSFAAHLKPPFTRDAVDPRASNTVQIAVDRFLTVSCMKLNCLSEVRHSRMLLAGIQACSELDPR
jgi:hypothetical protein